jgi:AGZA family xanthine/uracil permease-like MFS transporter
MAFLAKMPLAQASGMGLNSLLGGLVALWAADTYGVRFTMGQAFAMVLISGIVFLGLSVIKIKGKTFRELVFDGMPVAVRSAISVGIGLFIAYIGFQNAGVIVANPYTQVDLVSFTSWEACKTAVVALIGLFLIAILDKLNVKGSVILGIVGATIIGIPFGVTDVSILSGNGDVSWKFWENFANFFNGENSVFLSFTDVFKTGFPAGSLFTIIMVIITMCMIDMFDTMGTIVGCCGGNRILSDENNKPHNYGKIMICDAVATCTGAVLGTSTVTTFVESGAGVSAGGRTGLTAFTTACMFFLAMFAMPLFAVIPSAATAAALIYVGVLMMKNNVKSVDFSNAVNATSAFLTIVVMVLSYSITKGIGVGLISYTLMSALAYVIELIVASVKKTEKPKWNVSVVAIVVTLLFCVYFFVPTTLF